MEVFGTKLNPHISAARVREIGWEEWDPMGVCGPAEDWPDEEYDEYLFDAANLLWDGASNDEVIDYLACAELETLGMDSLRGAIARAFRTTSVLAAFIAGLRGAHGAGTRTPARGKE